MTFHSIYVGVDGTHWFVTVYAMTESNECVPFNVASELTELEANALVSILERIGDRLTFCEKNA